MKRILKDSAWSAQQIESFLREHRGPLRIAVQTPGGFPLLCSIWFLFEEGEIHCATHESSKLAKALAEEPRCSFEVAPNEPPYFGVRGRARVRLERTGAEALLGRLVDRYLGDRASGLARWLLGRGDEEYALRLEIESISAWDYRERMAP